MRRGIPLFAISALCVAAAGLWALALSADTHHGRAALRPLSIAALVEAPLEQLAVAVGMAQPAVWDDSPAQLGVRTKKSGCQIDGPYPDRACTPGAIFASSTVEQICVSGYTKTVRNVSAKLKRQVYAQYHIDYPQPTGSYEADHLIPLELGGNNDIANLFPEAGDPRPGFKEKDLVENYLHQQVCDGLMPLPRAQEKIATDWLAVYKSLSQSDLARLRAQYQSWADKN